MGKLITWIGLFIIGILAIPVAIFIFLISMIWSMTEKLVKRFGRKGDDRYV